MLGTNKKGEQFKYKKVFYHHFAIPEDQIRCLGLCEYFHNTFTVNEKEFNYYIKRNQESKFEFHIENPSNVEIRKRGDSEGSTDDFEEEVTYKGANIHLSFVFPNSE